jgi:hypothetical protein
MRLNEMLVQKEGPPKIEFINDALEADQPIKDEKECPSDSSFFKNLQQLIASCDKISSDACSAVLTMCSVQSGIERDKLKLIFVLLSILMVALCY